MTVQVEGTIFFRGRDSESELSLRQGRGKTTVLDRHQIRLRVRVSIGLAWRSDTVVFPTTPSYTQYKLQ